MNKENKIPSTLEECFDVLNEILNDGERDFIMMSSERDLVKLHHGLGQYIRNNWNLWRGGALKTYLKNLGFIHPDDMSSTIIEAYRAFLRKENFDLNKKIEEYKKYWNKVDDEQICSD